MQLLQQINDQQYFTKKVTVMTTKKLKPEIILPATETFVGNPLSC